MLLGTALLCLWAPYTYMCSVVGATDILVPISDFSQLYFSPSCGKLTKKTSTTFTIQHPSTVFSTKFNHIQEQLQAISGMDELLSGNIV